MLARYQIYIFFDCGLFALLCKVQKVLIHGILTIQVIEFSDYWYITLYLLMNMALNVY